MNHVSLNLQNIAEPLWLEFARDSASMVLELKNFDNWDMSILICDDALISELNQKYRKMEGPTDVLSFNQGDDYLDSHGKSRFLAGDIVISLPALIRNTLDFSVSLHEELQRLIIHGILHLSGMDHATNNADEPMLSEQEALLERVCHLLKEGLR